MERESSCYYQVPSPTRVEEDGAAAALMEVAVGAATPSASSPEGVEGALALIGAAHGAPVVLAPQLSAMPRNPAEFWGLSVDARRRGPYWW
jgi:hypothetical protein